LKGQVVKGIPLSKDGELVGQHNVHVSVVH
jgi:hypothetical protein